MDHTKLTNHSKKHTEQTLTKLFTEMLPFLVLFLLLLFCGFFLPYMTV